VADLTKDVIHDRRCPGGESMISREMTTQEAVDMFLSYYRPDDSAHAGMAERGAAGEPGTR